VSDNDDEAYLAAVEAMLSAEGMVEAAELLRTADTEVVEAGYDNWNRGTRLYTVVLAIDPAEYGRLGAKRNSFRNRFQLESGPSSSRIIIPLSARRSAPAFELVPTGVRRLQL
jgi:hypothetical protein